MWPETFSQYDEQQAILGYFDAFAAKLPEKPRFLDIGAWDPICFSNTRALFERGWGGVMIEPSPTPLLALLKSYANEPRVRILQAAVSTEALGYLAMHMTDDSVSTSDPQSYATWKDHAKFIGDLLVRTITWDEINNVFGGFQFVNIDAEGVSVDLFHTMVKSGAQPSCVCVEHDGRLVELAAAASANGVGYKMIYSNGTNAVFAK